MAATQTATRTGSELSVTINQEGASERYYRVVRPCADWRAIVKEALWRAVAAHPDRAGQSCRVLLTLGEQEQWPSLGLAIVDEDDERPLSLVPVSGEVVQSHALDIARQAGWEGPINVGLDVIDPDDPVATQWRDLNDDEDFEIVSGDDDALALPSDFSTEPLATGIVVRSVSSWTRCKIRRAAFDRFVAAASVEADCERGWAAPVRVHLYDDHCWLAIDDIVEARATSTRQSLHVTGHDFYAMANRLEGLGAFLHLHPTDIETEDGKTVELAPEPSQPDLVVARNLDASTQTPVTLLIGLFGTCTTHPGATVAAHAFASGALTEIQLEVMD